MLGWIRLPLFLRSRRPDTFGLKSNSGRFLFLIVVISAYVWYFHKESVSAGQAAISSVTKPYYEALPQSNNTTQTSENGVQRAKAVQEAFIHGWKGYKQFAFKHNELMPVAQSFLDSRAIWGATAIDSLSTAILMELPEIINDILDHIDTLDFLDTDMKVSMFSSTKTFIGGMLSAYDLLTGPKSHLVTDRAKISRLLQQSQMLADSLTFAFDTVSKLPQNYVVLKPKPKHRKVSTTDITAAGTLVLEWTHLSELVKDQKYADLVNRAENVIFNAFDAANDKCKQLFDGLMGKVMRLRTGKFEKFDGGYMSGSGSYYEYLIKMYIYSPKEYGEYRDRWIRAVDGTMKHLSSHPSSRPDLTFLASYDCTDLRYVTDHTAFFAAGNFILGGAVLHEQKYIDFGLQLVEGQVAKHRATVTGLAPERWFWLPEQCKDKENIASKECQLPRKCSTQSDFYAKHGHCVLDPESRVRPETLESLYYAYRVTRDPKYQDMSWEIFKAINRTARVPSGGFSEIADVNVMPDANGHEGRIDVMYSWVMGETLKYAWMIHADDDAEWQTSRDGKNKWVINTQAHPLRVKTENEEN